MNDSTNTPVRRRKSSGARKAITAAVVVALAGGGYFGWQKYQANKSKEGEYLTAPIEIGDIEDLVTSTGKLQPLISVDVGAQVSGQIEKIYVEVGDVVQKGDVLAEIDATTAIAKVASLEAQLLNAETQLKTQETNLEKATRDTKRAIVLYQADAATLESKLNAETTLENAKRSLTSSKAQLEVQRNNLTIEQRNLSYTRIIAPLTGTVMKVAVKQGQTINATQTSPTVLTIADLTTMTVLAEVSEADVGKIYPGIPLYFTTLSGGNRRWYTELKRTEPMPKEQNSVVLYNALFEIQNEGDLRPSQTAQVYFVSAEAKGVLMLPMAAIQQGQQISRELAQKEREKNGGKAGAGGAGGPPGGFPGGPPGGGSGAPGAAPGAAGAATANAPAAGGREGAATVAANTAPGAGSAPAAGAQAGAGNQANRPNGQTGRPGNAQGEGQGNRQGMRNGQAGGTGGGFNGPRPGGANGQRGGFNGQSMENMTPEERQQMMTRMSAQRGGGGGAGAGAGGSFQGANGQRPGGANGQRMSGFGGQRPGGNFAATSAGATAGPRPAQRRTGTVMVKKADGNLEARRVVYGVTNRVHAEVLEGLTEGEEVVVGKREAESASASTPRPNNNNNNNNSGNRGNNFQGGGGNFRPF